MNIQLSHIESFLNSFGNVLNFVSGSFRERHGLREYGAILVDRNVVGNLLERQYVVDFLSPDKKHQLVMPALKGLLDGCVV